MALVPMRPSEQTALEDRDRVSLGQGMGLLTVQLNKYNVFLGGKSLCRSAYSPL